MQGRSSITRYRSSIWNKWAINDRPSKKCPAFSRRERINPFRKTECINAFPTINIVKFCQKENFRFVHCYKYKQMFYNTIDKCVFVY